MKTEKKKIRNNQINTTKAKKKKHRNQKSRETHP